MAENLALHDFPAGLNVVKSSTDTPDCVDDTSGPYYPEGGFEAWAVVLGAACVTFSTFGLVNSFGVFQAYYEENLLHTISPSAISWIGSSQHALLLIPAVPMGHLLDLGHLKIPMAIISVCFIISVFSVAECNAYWQLFLSQGIVVGIFAGLLFGPMHSIVTHWFNRKRFAAIGAINVGSAIGGTVLPIAIRRLLTGIGFSWTIRILGFVFLITTMTANLLISRRLPPQKIKGGLFNWAEFKKPEFTFLTLAANFTFMGLFIPLAYFDVSARSVGISPNFSFYFISIANGASILGRIGGGVLGDRYGALNVLIPFTLVGAAVAFSWPYLTSIGPFVFLAFIYGICTGAFVTLFSCPAIKMGGMGDVGRRTGMLTACSAGGVLAGAPIAGALRTSGGGFKAAGTFAGSMVLAGAMLMIAARRAHLGTWKGKF